MIESPKISKKCNNMTEKSKGIDNFSNEKLRQDISDKLRKANQNSKVFAMNKCDPPALELDVYISEDHMEKLIVYKDDSPELVAKEF